VLTVFISHQRPDQVRRMVDYWRDKQPGLIPVVAYGGTTESFDQLVDGDFAVVFVDDPRLRTRDHQRERQSYLGVMRCIDAHLTGQAGEFIHLVEYDEVPVVENVHKFLVGRMEGEDADLLACALKRIDGTGDPHFLNHSNDSEFAMFWKSISCRSDRGVVLSSLGCGTFWRRNVFSAIAALENVTPVYLELLLPTAAHHLGFRVRPLRGQSRFMHPNNRYVSADLPRLAAEGAICAHPVKEMWDASVG